MSDLNQLYQQLILEHSKEKHGYASIDTQQFVSHQVNPSCGDEVDLGVCLTGDKVTDLAWQGSGCSISQASISIMHDLVVDKDIETINNLYENFLTLMHSKGEAVPEEILDTLEDACSLEGVAKYPARVKCALLGWMALKDALIKTTK